MSRTFFAEGLFTKGYIDYRRIESINPQIPELVNSIGSIKREIENLEDYEGRYSYLQHDDYIPDRLNELQKTFLGTLRVASTYGF
jgi:hypothetical protein